MLRLERKKKSPHGLQRTPHELLEEGQHAARSRLLALRRAEEHRSGGVVRGDVDARTPQSHFVRRCGSTSSQLWPRQVAGQNSSYVNRGYSGEKCSLEKVLSGNFALQVSFAKPRFLSSHVCGSKEA